MHINIKNKIYDYFDNLIKRKILKTKTILIHKTCLIHKTNKKMC